MANIDKTIVAGFVLTDTRLRSICRNLNERIVQLTSDTDAKYKLTFANGLVVNRPSLDEVLAEENEGERAIHALEILMMGRSEGVDIATITLKFTNSTTDPIYFNASSNNEKWVEDAGRDIEREIEKVQKIAIGTHLSSASGAGSGTVGLLATIIVQGIGNSLRSSDYVFAWGRGLATFNQRRAIANVISVAIVIGFAVGVLAGITANYISVEWLHIGVKP